MSSLYGTFVILKKFKLKKKNLTYQLPLAVFSFLIISRRLDI